MLYRLSFLYFGAISLILLFSHSTCSTQAIEFEVYAGPMDRDQSIVKVPLPESLKRFQNFQVINTQTEKTIPAQKLESGDIAFILDQSLAANDKQTYRLVVQSNGKNVPKSVSLVNEAGVLKVSVDDMPVLNYQIETAFPRQDRPDYYKRSGFIHPLYSPNGQILTDDFPVGHTHQHGIFVAWVNARFKGDKVDFWNQHHELGTIRHKALKEEISGPVFAQFKTELEHISLKHGPALNENWTVRIYNYKDYFIWDLESVQSCATDSIVYVDQYHYGGLGYRGSAIWNAEDKEAFNSTQAVLTSENKDRPSSNHTSPEWTAGYGYLKEKQMAGVAVMGHPDNFRFPQPVRVHPKMPYFCLAPMVSGGFEIQPGEQYLSKYRFLVFKDRADKPLIDRVWADYKNPVKVVIKENVNHKD